MKTYLKSKIPLALAASIPFLSGIGSATGQISSLVGSSYTENFDIMAGTTTTPTNWFVGAGASANDTSVVVSDGSVVPVATTLGYNFGSEAASDRALGTIPVGGDRNIEIRLRNDTGLEIQSFTVRYDGEQWRLGTMASASTLVLRYSSDGETYVNMGSTFDFTSPRIAIPTVFESVALDGNAAINRVPGIGGTYSPPTAIAPGAMIFLRWFDADDTGGDPGLAVDNFSFTIETVSGPPLSIRNNQNGTVTVSWAFPALGYILESTPELNTPSWTLVADGVDVPAEGRHNVTLSTAVSSMRYFRLRNPVGAP